MQESHPYTLTLSLSVLKELGINLYSNVSAVIAETIANAWDADAENVSIKLDKDSGTIIITDDGHGMGVDDVNEKYLLVGYNRREKGEGTTGKHGRSVMGRKGIGKLSLFSIAGNAEVQTVKNGVKAGFVMRLSDIKDAVAKKEPYHPEPLDPESIDITQGTKITLTDLKKNIVEQTETGLRTRLARRFSVIGPNHHFNISINEEPVTIEDRNYWPRLQYFWHYGDYGVECKSLCKHLDHNEARSATIPGTELAISGWIGTVKESGSLKADDENSNKMVVIVRGKLAQEDIMEQFGETGVYKSFVIGEIRADFLDVDDADDIATSSRQNITESDPRYQQLKSFLHAELKHIQSAWSDLRDEDGTKKAEDIPAIKDWMCGLSRDDKKRAKALFGKINRLPLPTEADRKRFFKWGVLAFESMRYKQSLDKLDDITTETIQAASGIFTDLEDIEATLYHQIIRERIAVIDVLQEKVEDNAREKVIQEHLFKNMWLLDPSWERAVETPYFEERVKTAFAEVDAKLTPEELSGRLDIRYTTTSGKHVIVELKRPDRAVSTYELTEQISKYRSALGKILDEVGKGGEPIECVCVVGRDLKDWTERNGREESKKMLDAKNARVVFYQGLINDAQKSYQQFLDKRTDAGRVLKVLQDIEEWQDIERPPQATSS